MGSIPIAGTCFEHRGWVGREVATDVRGALNRSKAIRRVKLELIKLDPDSRNGDAGARWANLHRGWTIGCSIQAFARCHRILCFVDAR